VSASDYPAPGVNGRDAGRLLTWVRAVSVEAWILGALVAVAAAIRIVTLDNQSLWADEALTAYDVSLPFGGMLHTIAHYETTPPLYFVLMWGWARVFGTGEVALRSVSAIGGIAVVPIAYLAARDLVSRRAGLVAAALVAVNPLMIWYSQEARAYMLLVVLTAASFLWFVRARQQPSWRNLGWWAAFSALAVMTHFFAGFLVAPEAVWLLWTGRTRATALAVVAVAAAQAAMLPFAISDASASHGVGWIAKSPQLNRIATTAIEWGASNLYRRVTRVEGLAAALLLAGVVALLLVWAGDGVARRAAAVAAAIAAFVFAVPLALGLVGQDYFLSRNEMPAFVPVIIVIAAACAAPRAPRAGAALAAAVLALFCITAVDVQTHPYLQRPNWRAVARSLGPAAGVRAILAADSTTADALKIYLPGVSWIQSRSRRMRISEIDIVGATKRLPLLALVHPRSEGGSEGRHQRGSPLPRRSAPPGARLLARYRVANWIVARFALIRPRRLSIAALTRLAPRFFRRAPLRLLVFTQPRSRP
jgi:mannosyltransferase